MLTLILSNVQYLKNVVFNSEKGSNGQNHFSSDSYHPTKKFSPAKFLILPHPVTLLGEPCLLKEWGRENSMH